MITLEYYGHSCFKISDGKTSVIIDPYKDSSVPGLTLPKGIKANLVLCSHNHADHNAKELIEVTNEPLTFNIKTFVLAHDHHNGEKRGFTNGYIMNISGFRICHLGDLGNSKDEILNNFKDVDLLLSPINGFYTIGAIELLELANKLNPKTLIPMHYYRKEQNSGYPDGNQIEIFKSNCESYKEVNKPTIIIDKDFLENKIVVLNSYIQ